MESVYTALEDGLTVLAAIGMRVVFDRSSALIGIDPDKSFAKKLEQLHQQGHIGATVKEFLEVLTAIRRRIGGWGNNDFTILDATPNSFVCFSHDGGGDNFKQRSENSGAAD